MNIYDSAQSVASMRSREAHHFRVSHRQVEWSLPMIAAFWDFVAAQTDLHGQYFSQIYSLSLIKFVSRHVSDLGEVADFGCGPGFLVEQLLMRDIRCWGVDYSEQSLNQVVLRLGSHPEFAGCVTVEAAKERALTVDTVFCIETLEHLLPSHHDETLRSIRGMLRPGGTLVLTVPNEEELEAATILCPECHAVFHRWQHMTSWSATALESLLAKHGFSTVFCGAIDLRPLQRREEWRNDWWGGRAWQWFLSAIDTRRLAENVWKLAKEACTGRRPGRPGSCDKQPNLIYIGRYSPAAADHLTAPERPTTCAE